MNFNKFLRSLFGDKSSRDMKLIQPLVEKVKAIYPEIQKLDNDQLRQRTKEIQRLVQDSAQKQKEEINKLKATIEDIIEYGYVKGRPALGISCVSIENRQYMYYYGVSTYGVYVKEAIGQNAKTAGLQEGDLIVGIDNYDVISYTTMKEALENYNVGDVVKLKIIRGTEEITLNLALDEKKVSQ